MFQTFINLYLLSLGFDKVRNGKKSVMCIIRGIPMSKKDAEPNDVYDAEWNVKYL